VYRFRPALAVAAALTLTVAAAAPAFAAATPAHGSADSTLRLLHVELAGHAVSAGEIAAAASNSSPHVARLVVTPAALDGTTYGQQTVTPTSSPATLPSGPQTATIPGGLASVTGPTFTVSAKDGTTVVTSAVLKALGSLSVGPLPVSLDATAATLTNTAEVTATQASADKSVVLGNLSLPSVADLLSALHIDPESLYTSLTQANLKKLAALVGATAALASLNTAVDAAQAAVGSNAPQSFVAALDAIDTAQAAANQAATDDTTANTAFSDAIAAIAVLPAGVTTALTPAQYLGLDPTTKGLLDGLDPNLAGLASTALAADAAKAAADTALTKLQDLAGLLDQLSFETFLSVVDDNTSLASLGSISVATKAVASMSSPVPVAEATVGTVNILGAITPPAALTSTLNSVLAQLAGVLNSVAGISFTPPSVAVGVGKTARSVTGTTHHASASITAVVLTLPKLTLPTSFVNLSQNLPGLARAGVKGFSHARTAVRAALPTTVVTNGGSLSVGTLAEVASYTPAVTAGSPGSGSKTPNLAGTGGSYALAVLAALLVMSGLMVARRRRPVVDSV
jgi:hypothetical protein